MAGLAAGVGIYLLAKSSRLGDNPEEVALSVTGTGEGQIESPASPTFPDDSPVARIEEWMDDPDLGSLAVLTILKPDQAWVGRILRVQRKGEFLCRIRVGSIEEKGAIATIIGSAPKPPPGPEDYLTLD